MKKRIVALLLPVVMAASVLAGCTPAAPSTTAAGTGTSTTAAGTTAGTTTAGTVAGTTTAEVTSAGTDTSLVARPDIIVNPGDNSVIIGSTTEPTGDFATPWWQNNATDNDINQFINGLSTIEIKLDGEIVLNNTVVAAHETKDNDDGTKTYQFTIKDGLVYSDGSPITAKDYVASVLLFSSPVLQALEAKPTYGNYYVGYQDFLKGKSKQFEGVRLIDDMTFSVTIDKEFVPSYYALAQASVGPTKLDYWLNNADAGKVEIKDDGKGAYFSDNFTEANFGTSIQSAKNNPDRPASGPYKVKSWDPAAKIMVLEVNDKYPGNFEGKKASIGTVIFRHITSATAMDELRTGGVDLLTSMMSGTEINAGFTMVEDGTGNFDYFAYPRAGYGKLAFVADVYPTKDVEVRQAIAHLLDRNKFAQAFTGGFGTVVNGPYGEGQWFYKESQAALTERINQYPYDLEEAKKLLDKAGWNLDKDGKPYAGTGLRYKENPDKKGEYMPLVINWGSSENNPVSELLVTQLQKSPDVAAAGMEIKQTLMTFEELLNYVYRDASQGDKYAAKEFNMFNFASNFPVGYVPRDEYTTDPDKLAQGYNTNFIVDKDLEALAEGFWKVDSTEKEKFLKGWQDYIVKWNELLPDLPLYSNQIHDFFNSKLKNYEASATGTLLDSILYATVED